ncbi:hypothetical protein WHR41_01794 [Cladosporium halotolerans]|uniref:MARVEL domain-containing protein n=1 Tax=Cladosporium halotolerans TaxID=1052096 RepID=A0AB34L1P8_9PEZI
MGLIKGGFLRLLQTALYALCFCCAGIVLGIYSYFLSVRADRNQGIPTWQKAVEGISGVAVLYTIAATVLTCCLGGISFFAFTAIVLDILFVGGFIALAVLTRDGASSCTGTVDTPLGTGNANANRSDGFGSGGIGTGSGENLTYSVSPRTACRLNTAAFAVSIIAAFLFVITALMQIALVRKHKKEKRFGPSPANNYTSGPGKKRAFWNRKKNTTADRDTELGATGTAVGAGGLAAGHPDTRPSHETGYTGSTVAASNGNAYDKVDGANGYNTTHQNHAPHGAHGGYYTQPQGTGVNPYGYDNTQPTYTTGTATNY